MILKFGFKSSNWLAEEHCTRIGNENKKKCMTATGVDNNALLVLVKALADAQIRAGPSTAGGYIEAKPPSFSGKKKDWPLFKMQLQAYLSTLGLEGVLDESFEKKLPARQDKVLDESDADE